MDSETETPRSGRGRPAYGDMERRALVAAVACRAARGETLEAIFADMGPGAPSRGAFYCWVRDDPMLARIYRHARREGRRKPWAQPPGKPYLYTPMMGEMVCEALVEGLRLAQVCDMVGMPSMSTVYRWMARHPEFARMYSQAREAQAHRLFDEALEIAEAATETSWKRDKLRIDTLRWTVAKLAPRNYGPASRLAALEEPPEKKVWQIYLQQYGQPQESAKLVSTQEIEEPTRGRGRRWADERDDE